MASGGLGALRGCAHLVSPARPEALAAPMAGALESPRGWFGGLGVLLLDCLVVVSASLPSSCVHTSIICWWLHTGALVLWGRLRGARRVARAWGQHPCWFLCLISSTAPSLYPSPSATCSSSALIMGDGPGDKNQRPGDLCCFFFQLVKKLSDVTGCTQVVDVGSGQVSQKDSSCSAVFESWG